MFVTEHYKIPTNSHESRVKANISKRQGLKKKWDRHCKYEASEVEGELPKAMQVVSDAKEVDFEARDEKGENWTRLLDEGVVVDGDGYAYAVIRKGVLKKAFEAIPRNFKGYIDKDHIRAIHLGYYGKKDLRLVELGEDRYAIDVNVKLDNDLYAVKDIIREGRHTALSVEMFTNVDEFATAEKVTGDPKQGKWLVPLIDELKIEGFAVCENPKNANSVNDGLLENASVEEGNNMTDEEKQKLAAEQEAAAAEAEAKQAEDNSDSTDADEKASDTEEENIECNEANTEGGEAEGEGESTEDEGEAEKSGEDNYAKLEEAIKSLKADIAERDEKIANLEAQLTAKAEASMSAEDRVAKLIGLAVGAEASAAEGAENKTANEADDEKKEADELAAAYAAAFAEQ